MFFYFDKFSPFVPRIGVFTTLLLSVCEQKIPRSLWNIAGQKMSSKLVRV